MPENRSTHSLSSDLPRSTQPVIDGAIPDLIARVYEAAPQEERRALLATLLRPLSLLSLAAIGSGIFVHLRLHGGWPEFQPAVEDLRRVRSSDMVALVHHVQQVSVETVNGLTEMFKGSPVMVGPATAAMLLALMLQRSRRRRADAVEAAIAAEPGKSTESAEPGEARAGRH